LQIQIFGDVLRDITATVIFDEYFAFGSIRVAGNTRKHQSNQQRPLYSLHDGTELRISVEMRNPQSSSSSFHAAYFADVWLFRTSYESNAN
jgi:hypothetical protein